MLFRVGLGIGALGIGALAQSLHQLDIGITLDGNQVGLLTGGVLILLGAMASSGILKDRRPLQAPPPPQTVATSPGDPPEPGRA